MGMDKRMKKLIIHIIFIFITFSIYSEGIMKVLVLPFVNNSENKGNTVYNKLINDTIVNDLTKVPRKINADEFKTEILEKITDKDIKDTILKYYEPDILTRYYTLNENITDVNLEIVKDILDSINYKKFLPVLLDEINIPDDVADYRKIYDKAFSNKIDLIISGFYIEYEGKIRITFKVMDVLTERMKIVYSKTGESGYGIFDVILNSTKEFINKMYEDINAYPPDINRMLREKQSRIIAGDVKETFIFFNVGINYLGTGFYNVVNKDPNKLDLTSTSNRYMNGISPTFKIEIYRNYKNKYFGFGFKFLIPFIYNLKNMQMGSEVKISFLLGLKKQFFFDFSIKMYYMNYSKFFSSEDFRSVSMFYMGFGFGFDFRYMPKRFPFFIEAGLTILPPKGPFGNIGEESNGPTFWSITANTAHEKSWIFPIVFHHGVGYFFDENFGIYLRNNLYFLYVVYDNYEWRENDERVYKYYGEDIAARFDIEVGIAFRGVFK